MESPPRCGLYRTLFALPGAEQAVPPGALVYFHNHSEQGAPIVLMPQRSFENRWRFVAEGHLVKDEGWPDTLVPLQKEGFYQTTEELWLPGARTLPSGLLVQLGYSRRGQAIAFPGELASGTQIRFRDSGVALTDLQAESLDQVGFKLMAIESKAKVAALHLSAASDEDASH